MSVRACDFIHDPGFRCAHCGVFAPCDGCDRPGLCAVVKAGTTPCRAGLGCVRCRRPHLCDIKPGLCGVVMAVVPEGERASEGLVAAAHRAWLLKQEGAREVAEDRSDAFSFAILDRADEAIREQAPRPELYLWPRAWLSGEEVLGRFGRSLKREGAMDRDARQVDDGSRVGGVGGGGAGPEPGTVDVLGPGGRRLPDQLKWVEGQIVGAKRAVQEAHAVRSCSLSPVVKVQLETAATRLLEAHDAVNAARRAFEGRR